MYDHRFSGSSRNSEVSVSVFFENLQRSVTIGVISYLMSGNSHNYLRIEPAKNITIYVVLKNFFQDFLVILASNFLVIDMPLD